MTDQERLDLARAENPDVPQLDDYDAWYAFVDAAGDLDDLPFGGGGLGERRLQAKLCRRVALRLADYHEAQARKMRLAEGT